MTKDQDNFFLTGKKILERSSRLRDQSRYLLNTRSEICKSFDDIQKRTSELREKSLFLKNWIKSLEIYSESLSARTRELHNYFKEK